jgi:pyruvate,water dikinase
MKRAAAIVAEEGGITGHVSVVSREFNIPCVVGIGKITEIIKDDDMVEVDAEKGVVRIIEKHT